MARVSGPFMSVTASGTIGKTLTASKWKGRAYMRSWFKPANPKTDGQMSIRLAVGMASQEYAGLEEAEKTAWNEFADGQQLSGIAVFVRKAAQAWMTQHGTGETPDGLSVSDQGDPAIAVFTWTAVM